MKPKTAVVVAGLPLSGKTSLCVALAEKIGFHFIDIDEGPAHCVYPQESDPLRSDEARARERARMKVAYTVLHAAIEANLAEGFSVIASATYSRHISQDFLQAAVQQSGGTLKIILCQFDDALEEIERRIADRIARNVVGGCRSVSHYIEDKARYAGIKFPHLVVMMGGGEAGLRRAVAEALAYIED